MHPTTHSGTGFTQLGSHQPHTAAAGCGAAGQQQLEELKVEVSSRTCELRHGQTALRQAYPELARPHKHDTPAPLADREGSEA
jgi:hypothetical protein